MSNALVPPHPVPRPAPSDGREDSLFIPVDRTTTVAPLLDEMIRRARSTTSGSVELRIVVSDAGVEVRSMPVRAGHARLGGDGTFSQWFRALLAERRLSQEAAARRIGVSLKTVSRWLHGTTEPRLRELRRVRQAFDELPPFLDPEPSIGTRA